MKIKNEKEIFDLFVNKYILFKKDFLHTPFIQKGDGRVLATDGHIMIMVNSECVSGTYETRDYHSDIIPARDYNCDKPLLVSDLRDALKRCPQVKLCPECNGDGIVAMDYRAVNNGRHYTISCCCPVCNGEGVIEKRRGEPAGKMIPKKGSFIKFGKGYFRWQHIDKIIKTCEMLEIEKIKLVRTDRAFPSTFELDKDIHICVMPLISGALSEQEKKSAINVKFTK